LISVENLRQSIFMPRHRPAKPNFKREKQTDKGVYIRPPLPLEWDHPVYPKLKDLGLPVTDEEALHWAAHDLTRAIDCGMIFKFPVTKEEKVEALREWAKEELIEHMATHGLEESELDPLMWDEFASTALILYRVRDKSFWSWNTKELRMVGHYWTDLLDPFCF
jgi:hypothetical protein